MDSQQATLAEKVLCKCQKVPQVHDQSKWVNHCKCTRCAGGWTLYFAGYELVEDGTHILVRPPNATTFERWTDEQLVRECSQLLGIDYSEAWEMFYDENEQEILSHLSWLIFVSKRQKFDPVPNIERALACLER